MYHGNMFIVCAYAAQKTMTSSDKYVGAGLGSAGIGWDGIGC